MGSQAEEQRMNREREKREEGGEREKKGSFFKLLDRKTLPSLSRPKSIIKRPQSWRSPSRSGSTQRQGLGQERQRE